MYKFLQIEEKLEPSNQYTIAYTDWGKKDSKKIIFCVHGMLRNCRDFDYLAKYFEDQYRVICIDVVGRGRSSRLENKVNYNNPLYVRGILQFLKKLCIEKVIWVGSSMGGILGMIINKITPDVISSIVLNDVGAFINNKILAEISSYLTAKHSFADFNSIEKHLRLLLSTFGVSNDDEERWSLILENSIIHPNSSEGNFEFNYDKKIYDFLNRRIIDPIDANMWNMWNALNIPVLVMRGEKSTFLTQETLDKMIDSKSEIGNLTTHLVPKVGHTPSLMYDDQLQLIKNWLDAS